MWIPYLPNRFVRTCLWGNQRLSTISAETARRLQRWNKALGFTQSARYNTITRQAKAVHRFAWGVSGYLCELRKGLPAGQRLTPSPARTPQHPFVFLAFDSISLKKWLFSLITLNNLSHLDSHYRCIASHFFSYS